MFIGHFGAGFAAKKIDSGPSLGTMFMASQFIDLLWPILLLLGIERVAVNPGDTAFTPLNFVHYPFSHSFLGVLAWAALFGIVHWSIKRNLRSALLLGALVLSHWFLDLIVHRPDLPLFPWGDVKVGLGMWNSVFLTLIVELLIFSTGVYIYQKTTHAENKTGLFGFWGLVVFLVLVYLMNAFGPPPPSEGPIAYMAFSMWLLIAWGYWIDRNRRQR